MDVVKKVPGYLGNGNIIDIKFISLNEEEKKVEGPLELR
jgi:hypothetical protein